VIIGRLIPVGTGFKPEDGQDEGAEINTPETREAVAAHDQVDIGELATQAPIDQTSNIE
jgi:hypothetical protein